MGKLSKKLTFHWLAVAVLRLLLTASPAYGDLDFDHQRNALPGARASGLGGAYTALSEEPEGAFYNPAGLVYGRSQEISLSVNNRQVSEVTYRDINALNGEDFVETSDTFYPGFVGSTYRFGKVTLGWSYVTLDAKDIDQTDEFPDLNNQENNLKSFNRTHQESNNYFLAGGSLAFSLSKTLSFGVSQYYYRRSVLTTNHQLVQSLTDGFLVLDQKFTTVNEGLNTVVGLMLRFETVSFGLSTRFGRAISNRTQLHSDTVAYSGDPNESPAVVTSVSSVETNDEVNPTTIGFGFSWFPSKWFLVSSDVFYHGEAKRNLGTTDAFDLEPTFNYAFGTELKLGPLIVRAGYFTNNSQNKIPDENEVNQPEHVDYIGQSLGVALADGLWEGGFGVVQQIGSGKAQKIGDDTDIQDVEAESISYQLNASYGLK